MLPGCTAQAHAAVDAAWLSSASPALDWRVRQHLGPAPVALFPPACLHGLAYRPLSGNCILCSVSCPPCGLSARHRGTPTEGAEHLAGAGGVSPTEHWQHHAGPEDAGQTQLPLPASRRPARHRCRGPTRPGACQAGQRAPGMCAGCSVPSSCCSLVPCCMAALAPCCTCCTCCTCLLHVTLSILSLCL